METGKNFYLKSAFIASLMLKLTVHPIHSFQLLSPAFPKKSSGILSGNIYGCNLTELQAKTKTKPSGGGFGAGNGGLGMGKTKKSGKKQIRTVSGYTGSGTKPLRIAANTFDDIRKDYGKEGTSDVYVRSPLNDEKLCWFVGKVCRRLDLNDKKMNGLSIPTEFETVISQKRLILEYSKNQLRPQNFGGPYSKNLEILIAPGDSEMDVVQNKISLQKVTGSVSDLSDTFDVSDVGYNPEIYIGDEARDGGLRVSRDEDGKPINDVFEINN
mmetsp:Transcript_7483/g.10708  ORF Transcript_7483/g.10708 Transcript_7483/m.10708 type:complete len:270 (+) Transcript_7483:77-886(+)|eukprot:CAMPEP_0184868368 /NCGR_PEP_ID=MMETSP0580-20130426/30235_1 /TAXON_ID=1118495 /ORGANISM="Dactyliosolen fragilissimus" /LENGTH=269 /DNA_ID=CAMNT_0027369217 /DNA_START=36 /DNA_END=845 /DNA_ORIENTATION=+